MTSTSRDIAKDLERQVPEILRRWAERVCAALPAARRQQRPALLNSMPQFLDELVHALAQNGQTLSRPRTPREHAEQRANLPDYSLEQVVQEYSLLRAVILDVLAEPEPIELADARVILELVDFGIAEATTHFFNLHDRVLRESEERFRLLVENVHEYAIFMLNPDGIIISWNRGAEQIKGYTAEEVLGKHFSIFYAPNDVRDNKPVVSLERAARDGRFESEGVRVRKDGSIFFANVVITVLRDESGTVRGFAKITRDITERQALQAELERHVESLAEANRRKDEFLAMLAHELRNPLAAIVSSAEVLRLHPARDPGIEQAQAVIERQGKHLAHLVDDLLDVARITQGKIILRRTPIELKDLTDRVVETLQPFVEERGQTLAVNLPETPVWVKADFMRLSQVLANLVHNSAKFTDPGGRIDVSVWIEEEEVVVQVRDNGKGIHEELLPHVFDTFTQDTQAHDDSVSGLGIGLTLVRRLVEMHGGTVSAHSEGPGRGSEFTVRLPVLHLEASNNAEQAAAQDERELPQQTEQPARPVQVNKDPEQQAKQILIVDDNVDAVASLAALLEFSGHEVRTVHFGREALQAIAAEQPEVILLDIGLPDIDGHELARLIRSEPDYKNIRLIALTGYGQEQDKRRSEQAGFDAHLTKPANLNDVLGMI